MNKIDVTPQNQRFESLDLIRGIAIIGILLINIQSFGFVISSYMNPFVGNDLVGLNLLSWLFTHIVVDQKLYTIFSMLFGAGIVLLASRIEDKGLSAAKYHYRRNFFLLIIGLCHASFIWYGDILTIYAFLAFFVYFFWRAQVKTLLIVGLSSVFIVVPMFYYFSISLVGEQAAMIQADFWPSMQQIADEKSGYLGNYAENFVQRASMGNDSQTYEMVAILRIFGSMLIGMALLKTGFLNGQLAKHRYIRIAKISFGIGLPLVLASALSIYLSGFEDAVFSRYRLGLLNYTGSFFLAIAYIAMINLWFISDKAPKVKERLKAMGQMAFTNYLLQSVICTTIFYGFGLGLFGQLSRFEMLMIALAVVLVQFVYSAPWLKRFKMGPLEWVFRWLTYFKLPTFVRRSEPELTDS